MADLTENWANVKSALEEADSIAFDGCHKIYVLMDPGQTEQMTSYGYRENEPGRSWLITKREATAGEMLEKVQEWFESSCGLRFINQVRTVEGNPNDGFTALISQFEADDDDEEDDGEDED